MDLLGYVFKKKAPEFLFFLTVKILNCLVHLELNALLSSLAFLFLPPPPPSVFSFEQCTALLHFFSQRRQGKGVCDV